MQPQPIASSSWELQGSYAQSLADVLVSELGMPEALT